MDETKLKGEIETLRKAIDLDKIDRISRVSKIVSFIVIPVMFVLFIYGSLKLTKLNNEISNSELKLGTVQTKLTDLRTEMDLIISTSLNAFGWPIEDIEKEDKFSLNVTESLNANNKIREVIFDPRFKLSTGVTIQYYPKSKDKYKVVPALEEFGFDVNTRSSNPLLTDQETNAVWFGKSVPIEDVKLVTFTLIRAGVEIKFVIQAENLQSNKLLIGTSSPNKHMSRMLVSDIHTTTEFPKCPTLRPCNSDD